MALFQIIVDNMLDAALILDWDGTMLYVNRAALKLVGASSLSETLGNNAAQFIHPDSLLTVATDLERVRVGQDGFFSEYRLITRQGQEKWVEGLGTKIIIAGRELNLVILRDIVARKLLAEELQQASEELENRVRERTSLLTEANQRLQDEITERGRTTEALRKTEEKYHTFLDTLRDMVFITDRKGHFTYVNQMFETILGWPSGNLVGRVFSEIVAAEFHDETIDRYRRGMNGDAIPIYELDFLRPDGRRLPVELNVTTLHNPDGNAVGRIGVARDISGRRQAETLYRTLANTSRAGVYIVQKGKFRFINHNAARYAGYTEEELIGMNALGIVLSQDRPSFIENSRKMLAGEMNMPYEFRICTKDGQIRWIMETVTSIVYEGEKAVLGNSMDITELRQARMKLEQSEQRLAQIIEGTTVPTFVIDGDHRITHWNRACENLTGIYGQEIIGTKSQWTAFYAQARLTLADLVVNQAGEEMLTAHYEGKQRHSELIDGAYEVETFFPDLPPKGKWLYITTSPLRDVEGRITGAIETLQDMTERKEMEEEVRLMAVTDHLTGLYNRRGFVTLAEQQLKLSARSRKSMILYSADMDGMKQINDTWGHDEGDRALINAASILRDAFRASDILARIGGDEFAVFSIDAMDVVPQSLVKRIEIKLHKFNSRKKHPYCLSMSIGVVFYDPEHPCSLDDLMCRADDEMYACKNQKRCRQEETLFK
jgi:diguanylate cyclase (GGDEF)-like protein/PAS domain S-box-containing protein